MSVLSPVPKPLGFAVAGQPRRLSLHELVRRAGGVCRVKRFIEEADEQLCDLFSMLP
jgi:hypothetical protein